MSLRSHPPLCRGCRRERRPGEYLCTVCWFSLSNETRHLLRAKGDDAAKWAAQLYDQIRKGVPLGEIRIVVWAE